MGKQNFKKVFLSASIPSIERNPLYYNTADIVAIKDAIQALATTAISKTHLIWGGHPSITPLLRSVMQRMNIKVHSHITLYLSKYFEQDFLGDNFAFENIRLVEKSKSEKESLEIMRNQMFSENEFAAGIFIGGMEGVETEYELFTKYHPNALILPVASTGAASRVLYHQSTENFDNRLLNDYAYMALFRDLLKGVI
jgi:hypothetical protein